MTDTTQTSYISQPLNRVDAVAKVTGRARYAGEYNVPGLLHGVVISSPIARGRIISFDASPALDIEGVINVYSHVNVPGLAWFDLSYKDMNMLPGKPFRPFNSSEIQFSMQPVALVVAESLELARYASRFVRITYEKSDYDTSLENNREKGFIPKRGKAGYNKPKSRGKAEQILRKAETRIQAEYLHGAEHHNPMELFASTVVFEKDGSLIIYDKTQGVLNSQSYVARVFGLKHKKVRVLSPYVGGAFGSGLRPQYQLFMAVLAALDLQRPVRVTLTRQQMFSFGHRPVTWQKVEIASAKDGALEAMAHSAVSETSRFENYTENIVNWTARMYACDHVKLDYKLVPLDVNTPLDMRGPGATTGLLALECAMDEMAFKLSMDPLAFRMRNYTETDPEQKRPFSSKALMECYKEGAEHFGWEKRLFAPRSARQGKHLIGYGMSTGMWDAMMVPARAAAHMSKEGKLTVSSATSDIGTGTYTIMTQIAADTVGLPIEDVTFHLGDSKFVYAPYEGGSATAASVGTAVLNVCHKIRERIFHLAEKMDPVFFNGLSIDDVQFSSGKISRKDDSSFVSIKHTLANAGIESITEKSSDFIDILKKRGYSRNSHSAVFAEVKVDEDLGMISVTRVVSAIAAGAILNPKTARNQVVGGIMWGISMALHEDSFMDHNLGRFINHDFAEYHIPVHADTPEIEVIFVREEDKIVNPLGVKGVGELGIIGVAAAIANAVFHATGKRVRTFPITLDKLL